MVDTTPTQPPDNCPACGCTEFRDHEARIYFKCGEAWQWGKEWWKTCDNAFSAAVALRAERDAALAQVAALTEEVEGAYEVTEPLRARLAELQDAISCELPILFMLMPSVHGRLLAALESGAVVEGEVTK